MGVTWVLVADSSRARIFSKNGKTPLMEQETMIHPESRLHETDLTSDLPGRDSSRMGGERHGVNQKVSPKEHEATTFSKQVAGRLESARTAGDFNKLFIVAPPQFLGKLRDEFSHPLKSLVSGEMNKNLSHLKGHQLMDHLPARF